MELNHPANNLHDCQIMNVDVSFVILSFNSEAYLEQCFNALITMCRKDEISYEIIVIDNGSRDSSLDLIQAYKEKHSDSFKIIELPENRGTTYTRNLGLKSANGTYVCILDSDTEFREGSLHDILLLLKEDEDIGIVAPQLVLPDGTIQNSVKKFPTLLDKLIKLPKVIANINTTDKDFYEDFPFQRETFVESAISACWFFRKDIIARIGYFDENIFYSPEDLDFCIRLHKGRMKIVYYPKLKILHHTQHISHRKPFSKMSIGHFFGLLYYFRKHGGWISTRNIYN